MSADELTGDEPDLRLGDSGEGVVLLQVRLYRLQLYRQVPDGTYDMLTENAVRELQSNYGQDNTGTVTRDTWQAICYFEQQAGIRYQYLSPYDALAQLTYDLAQSADAAEAVAADPSLSADGQWRWDGMAWQPADQYAGQLSEDGLWRWDGCTWVSAGELSPDGHWRWDGAQWQVAAVDDYVGQLSEDGRWRWDGRQWSVA